METFFYDNCGKVIVGEDTYFLSNLSKQCKTRTVRNGIWSTTIKTKDIKISPCTYWRIGKYTHQFGGYDFYCYLCEYAGTTPSKCKCKQYFTVEENFKNIETARRNYLVSVVSNYFDELLPNLESLQLTPNLVDRILFKEGKYGERVLAVFYPPTFDYRDNYRNAKRIKSHLEKQLTSKT